MNGLAASRPCATTSSVGAVAPPATSSMTCSVASASTIMIGDVAVGERPGRRRPCRRSRPSSSAWVGKATHWPSMSATRVAADRAGERQAGQLGGHRGRVDRDHVVEVVRVERHDGLDDLDLVAQALDERRAQRAVDQPAGEDRVLARPALAAEERAGDPARRVHPLLDVHRQREEVEVLLRVLGRRGGGQQHRLVVEVRHGGPGGLLGQPAGLEADRCGCRTCRCRWSQRTRGSCFLTLFVCPLPCFVRPVRHEAEGNCSRSSMGAPGLRQSRGPLPRTGAFRSRARRSGTEPWSRTAVAVRGGGAARWPLPLACYRRRPSRSISDR